MQFFRDHHSLPPQIFFKNTMKQRLCVCVRGDSMHFVGMPLSQLLLPCSFWWYFLRAKTHLGIHLYNNKNKKDTFGGKKP